MKKQRWRFTKNIRECSSCGCRIDTRDKYAMTYGFCGVGCGMDTFGLSWSDFI